jgi:hypothetical protein
MESGEPIMKQEGVAVADGVKRETSEAVDPAAWRSAARVTPQLTAFEEKTDQPVAQQQSLLGRIKGIFANVAKALEGDHETHKYRS